MWGECGRGGKGVRVGKAIAEGSGRTAGRGACGDTGRDSPRRCCSRVRWRWEGVGTRKIEGIRMTESKYRNETLDVSK